VDDVEIDQVRVNIVLCVSCHTISRSLGSSSSQGSESKDKKMSDYVKEGRQGFGVLLLLFEWGTT